jgi:hypothetical protein
MDFLLAYTNLVHYLIRHGFKVELRTGEANIVHFARTACLEGHVRHGVDQKPFQGRLDYDYMMWIDSDIVFPPEAFLKLLTSPHDVTCGLYHMIGGKAYPVVRRWDEELLAKTGSFQYMTNEDVEGLKTKGLVYVEASFAGMGWMLIRRGVVERLKYPWFVSTAVRIGTISDICSEDVSFCRKLLLEAGTKVYVDLNCSVGHLKPMLI